MLPHDTRDVARGARLRVTRLGTSIDRAAAWIDKKARGEGVPVNLRLQALFGLSVAERAGSRSATVGDHVLAVREAVSSGDFDPYDYDARLVLQCGAAMRKHGIRCEPLEHFAAEAAETLRSIEVVPARLAGAALLLSAGTLAPDPLPPPGPAALLRADAAALRQLCSTIESLTGFGTRPLPPAWATALTPTLPVLLLHKLREYDLVLGASLLRSVCYLRLPADEDIGYATDFLVSQQQADGRYGYYARELEHCPELRDPDRELYLPVSITVLWALAETIYGAGRSARARVGDHGQPAVGRSRAHRRSAREGDLPDRRSGASLNPPPGVDT